METLKDRLIASGQTVAEVARRANTPPAHLYNILAGRRRPRFELAEALESACNGVITVVEWQRANRRVQDPLPSADRAAS